MGNDIWQTGQGTNVSVGFSLRLSSRETISTILGVSFLIIDDVGSDWILDVDGCVDVDHGVFVEGPPPSKRPCPLKGTNDVTGVGRDTTPPCVGLALFGEVVSGDEPDGAFTVMVELPLFFVAPTNPATAFPFTDGFDELKYPEMFFSLLGVFIATFLFAAASFTGGLLGLSRG